jgi:hypothetical protein
VSGAENEKGSELRDSGSRGGRSPPALFVAQVQCVRSYLSARTHERREQMPLNTDEKEGAR